MPMNAVSDLRTGLSDLAKRSVSLMKACNNDGSIKLYLVLPMIGLLGYDSSDPLEVYPNHESDLIEHDGDKRAFVADFAILNDGAPVIAFGAARIGVELKAKRDEIASYFNAWPTAKLAVLTNGILFEFYVDSIEPGTMDAEPFLAFDLQTIAQGGVPDDVIETLIHATKASLDPDMIAERAHIQLVRKRLRTAFVEEAQSPSDDLCRMMMTRIGFAGVRPEAIARHYAPLVKTALEEALVLPVVQRLKVGGPSDGKSGGMKPHVGQKIAAAERELAIFNTVRRRLAFLVQDEAMYQAIDRIDFKDYVGKLVVYFDRDPKGRLFELIRGVDGNDKFIFEEPHGVIVSKSMADIDSALITVFEAKVREIDGTVAKTKRSA
jgi:hypothetical protein